MPPMSRVGLDEYLTVIGPIIIIPESPFSFSDIKRARFPIYLFPQSRAVLHSSFSDQPARHCTEFFDLEWSGLPLQSKPTNNFFGTVVRLPDII